MCDTIMSAHYYLAQLDKELNKYAVLNLFEVQTGVPKSYLFLGVSAFLILMIFFDIAGQLFSNFVGWVYPGRSRFNY
jgi:receptor expression-enhancing protein 5/6